MGDEKLLRSWVQALGARLGEELLAVALFGSRARGDASPGSDWDLLVIASSAVPDEFDRARDLRLACVEHVGKTPSLLVLSQQRFESSFPTIYLDIAEDARVLAGEAYLAPKLERIRQIARTAGLSRVRSGSCFAWERRPRRHWRLDWDGYRDVA
jgi:predicted nucleotidyltransferase